MSAPIPPPHSIWLMPEHNSRYQPDGKYIQPLDYIYINNKVIAADKYDKPSVPRKLQYVTWRQSGMRIKSCERKASPEILT